MSDNIAKGRYRFTRLRSAAIPKPNGEKRMLGIPTVKDRIVMQAIRLMLETDCEKKMHDSCHANRPGRGAETAMEAMADAMGRGLCFVAETDIRKFFDTVRHSTVLDRLRWVGPKYAEFLGFRFQPDRISPTADNSNRLHEEIRHWCAKDEDISWPERIDRINGFMRSFAWYDQRADCGRMLWNLDHFVRE